MARVNQRIREILDEKNLAVRSGQETVLALLEELHGQVMAELGRAALGSWDQYYLRQYLDAIERRIAEFNSQAKKQAGGLLDGVWRMGASLIPAAAGAVYTGFDISPSVLEAMKDFAFHKFDVLSNAAWDQIKGELTLGIIAQKTPQDVAAAIGKHIDRGRFASIAQRAETIVKAEMRRVFSTAAEKRMEEAAKYVEGLEKQWLHAGHPVKARPTHRTADGQHVPVGQPFRIGDGKMMYPHDPDAPLEETINCGCDHVPYKEDWQ